MATKPACASQNAPDATKRAAAADSMSSECTLESLIKRRFFYGPSFTLYHGLRGFVDYGPSGLALKNNIVALWRRHFLQRDAILEIEATLITAEAVLKASGHVDKFDDMMVRDQVTEDAYRADHLLGDALEALLNDALLKGPEREAALKTRARINEMGLDEMAAALKQYVKTSPANNPLTEPYRFNLMFPLTLGVKDRGYLRPETAQGIFVNFQRALDVNQGRFPFGVAQVGPGFRNEISPRGGLLRLREFLMAEIEYFRLPGLDDRRVDQVSSLRVPIVFREDYRSLPGASSGELDAIVVTGTDGDDNPVEFLIRDLLRHRIVRSETVAYYIGLTMSFLQALGVAAEAIRFRQHLPNEMAHYAADCWDAEIKTTLGWVECVGIADRGTYDLGAHNRCASSNQRLGVFVPYDTPKMTQKLVATPNKQGIGRAFGSRTTKLLAALEVANESSDDLRDASASFQETGRIDLVAVFDGQGADITSATFVRSEAAADGDAEQLKTLEIDPSPLSLRMTLTKDHVSFEQAAQVEHGCMMTPIVIEPSFGISRIVHCVLEQAFRVRTHVDPPRAYLALPARIAPYLVTVMPLMPKAELLAVIPSIVEELRDAEISFNVDQSSSATIGRRYARADEIGIPYAITIDYTTREDQTVTLRDRDCTQQVRLSFKDAPKAIFELSRGRVVWDGLPKRFQASPVASSGEA